MSWKNSLEKMGNLSTGDVLDSAWDSPELCEAGVVSDRFVIGHWDDLSVLHDAFHRRLVYFLKTTFTDQMYHNHINNIMLQKEPYCLLVCGYRIDDEDFDIFSRLFFKYLDQDDFDAPTGIVYIVTSPMFDGLKLAPFILSILSNLLLFQHRSCILFALTLPSNGVSMCLSNFNTSNCTTNSTMMSFQLTKNAAKVFQYCV